MCGLLEDGLSTHPVKTDETDTSDDESPQSDRNLGKRGEHLGQELCSSLSQIKSRQTPYLQSTDLRQSV